MVSPTARPTLGGYQLIIVAQRQIWTCVLPPLHLIGLYLDGVDVADRVQPGDALSASIAATMPTPTDTPTARNTWSTSRARRVRQPFDELSGGILGQQVPRVIDPRESSVGDPFLDPLSVGCRQDLVLAPPQQRDGDVDGAQ